MRRMVNCLFIVSAGIYVNLYNIARLIKIMSCLASYRIVPVIPGKRKFENSWEREQTRWKDGSKFSLKKKKNETKRHNNRHT